MKISKRQLKRIIKEEKAKILKETVADMVQVDTTISQASAGIAEQFMDLMYQLFDEDPEMFAGRSTQTEWENQVDEATHELETDLREAMGDVIERIETQLHDGQYQRDMKAFR